nr:MAG TPA: hypothetical protein [Caudoviricetes sp.]
MLTAIKIRCFCFLLHPYRYVSILFVHHYKYIINKR